MSNNISLEGFIEQDIPFVCPECYYTLTLEEVIGFGEYPKGGFRNQLKPYSNTGIGFECPQCFENSCSHASEDLVETYNNWRKLHED